MTSTDPTSLLRRHTRRLAEMVDHAGAVDDPDTAPADTCGPTALPLCVHSSGGITEELLGALLAHNQALDTLESVVGPIRGRSVAPGDAVADAMEGAYQASDVAHDAVRHALQWMRDAVRFQQDALRVAHLAAMIAASGECGIAPRPPGRRANAQPRVNGQEFRRYGRSVALRLRRALPTEAAYPPDPPIRPCLFGRRRCRGPP